MLTGVKEVPPPPLLNISVIVGADLQTDLSAFRYLMLLLQILCHAGSESRTCMWDEGESLWVRGEQLACFCAEVTLK